MPLGCHAGAWAVTLKIVSRLFRPYRRFVYPVYLVYLEGGR